MFRTRSLRARLLRARSRRTRERRRLRVIRPPPPRLVAPPPRRAQRRSTAAPSRPAASRRRIGRGPRPPPRTTSVAAGAANAAPNPTAIARSASDPRGPRGTATAPSATHRARPRVAWHAPVQFRAIATRSNRGNRRRGTSRLVDAASSLTPSRLAHAAATASTSGENVVDPGRVDPRSAGSDATRSPSETSAATRSASAATFAAGASVEPTRGWSASFRSRTAARDARARGDPSRERVGARANRRRRSKASGGFR